jgi:hypothetical protein
MFYRAIAVLSNLLSMCISMYIVFLEVQAVTWHRAENLAALGLLLFGVPALLIQAVVLLPLTVWCARKSASGAPETRPRWSPYVAAFLVAVTLAAIVTGLGIEGIKTEQRRRRWLGDANHSRLPITATLTSQVG